MSDEQLADAHTFGEADAHGQAEPAPGAEPCPCGSEHSWRGWCTAGRNWKHVVKPTSEGAPAPAQEPREHEWVKNDPRWPSIRDIEFCAICTVGRRRDGKNKPCRGWSPAISLRAAEKPQEPAAERCEHCGCARHICACPKALVSALAQARSDLAEARRERDALTAQLTSVGIVPYLDRMKELANARDAALQRAEKAEQENAKLWSVRARGCSCVCHDDWEAAQQPPPQGRRKGDE